MQHYLSVNEVAALLDISVNSIKGYRAKGLMPEPDAKLGNAYGWTEDTIVEWHRNRPGTGLRPRPAD